MPIFTLLLRPGKGQREAAREIALRGEKGVAPLSAERYAPVVTVEPLVGEGLCARRVTVRARDVVYVKGIFEASEGLGALFAQSGGDLIIAVHASRLLELDELLRDLATEIGAIVEPGTSG